MGEKGFRDADEKGLPSAFLVYGDRKTDFVSWGQIRLFASAVLHPHLAQ